jgi:hypothetical protein
MERADDNHWVTEYLTYFLQELQSKHVTERPTEPKRICLRLMGTKVIGFYIHDYKWSEV